MAGIQDAIRRYRTSSVKRGGAGLGSPQLSPELLKALQVPKNKTLSDLFPAGVPGGSGTDYYDNTVKFFGGDPKNPRTELGKFFGNEVAKPILSLVEDAPKLFKALGGDRLGIFSGNPITDNIDDLLNKTPESTRQNLGQDILRQLSGEGRRQQGQLPMSEAEMARMGQGSGKYLDTRGQDVTDGVVDTSFDSDFDTDALIAEQGLDKKADEIAKDAVLASQDDAEANFDYAGPDVQLTAAELLAKKSKDAFTSLIKSVSAETGMDTTKDGGKPKTIEDYKLDFQKATGIDVSGEPDNKMALMSLGLSLMQNKAGKGFDLSKILGSVGEAGQAAMPAFERARQEAKQGQLAAGKFALQQTKADKDAIKSANTERAKYLRGRRDVILDRIAETATDQQKAYTKFKFDEAIEFTKAGKKSNKYNQIKTRKLIQGNDVLKVDIGYQGTTPMYANPTDNVRAIVGERKKIYRSLGRIDKLSGIITDMYNDSKGSIGGTAGQIVFDKTIGALSALGITDADAWFKTNGVSRNSQAETILRLLVQENKRFILKESGNGVSNLDKIDLEDAFGKIVWTNNLQENLNNLRQIKSLFDAPLSTLDSTLDGFITEKDKYQDTDIYNNTVSIINDGLKDSIQIKPGSGNNARRINVSDK